MSHNNLFISNLIKLFSLSLIIITSLIFSGCSGCSKSGLRNAINNKQNSATAPVSYHDHSLTNNTVKMEKQNGVYMIPVDINGVPMHFIFDTGAGLISISSAEAIFLYKQGKLSNEDIVGKANFVDANGTVSEGTIIILREVKIGNKILTNVEASVVNNLEAPILMGQSALQKFGKISIDYKNNEITFE
jgi:aspartyl protease family protein